jgi:hypothetical protein
MVFDLGVAIIYFGVMFDAYYTLVISVVLNWKIPCACEWYAS